MFGIPLWAIWLIFCGLLLLIEIFNLSFLLIWPGIGAFFAFIANILGASIEIQLAVFAISTILMILFMKPLAQKLFKTKDNTLIGFTTIQSDDITYEKIISDINATSQSLNGEVLDAETVDIGGIPSLRMTISTADQGYSRYYCTLRDGVYYSFVINNGKSNNKDISALNTTEIQNMINSISFQTTEIDAADGAEIA